MKNFFIVLMLTLVLGVSLCGCLQWLEIPDEHYSQASLVEAQKKRVHFATLLFFTGRIILPRATL